MRVKNIFKPFLSVSMVLLRIFPIKENKIVFSSFSARSYSDNPKYIAEEIIRRSSKYDCVAVLRNAFDIVPDGIRTVRYNSLKYLYEMATAKIWVDNTRKQPYILKRKQQIYIQTWHGCPWFKRIEKDAEEVLDREYIETAKNDSRNIDYLLTNSTWGEEHFRDCFWYNGKILKYGSPRLYLLFNHSQNDIERIRNQLKLKEEYQYLLYAPTFRKNGDLSAYNIDYNRLIESLKKRFGGNWGIIFRLHPNIREERIHVTGNVEIIDASLYADINEIYVVSDFLVTDYSSTIFDFTFAKKRALIYANDFTEYRKDRSTMMDIRELPFSFAENNDELEDNILNFDDSVYQQKLDKFHKELDLVEDGKAGERVFNLIQTLAEV